MIQSAKFKTRPKKSFSIRDDSENENLAFVKETLSLFAKQLAAHADKKNLLGTDSLSFVDLSVAATLKMMKPALFADITSAVPGLVGWAAEVERKCVQGSSNAFLSHK